MKDKSVLIDGKEWVKWSGGERGEVEAKLVKAVSDSRTKRNQKCHCHRHGRPLLDKHYHQQLTNII
jgi:hypothetical protein